MDPNNIATEPTLAELGYLIANILNVAARLIGIAAFVMLLVGGLQLLTASGDPKKTDQGKKTITAAIFGLFFIIGGWMAIKILEALTGTNLTIFNFCITGNSFNCI